MIAARLDFRDRSTWPGALHGAEHMLLMRPPAIADVEQNLNPFVDYARSQGVDHVVFLSVAGAGKNRFVPHRKVDDHLRARGDHHTNLRPGFFAQNLHPVRLPRRHRPRRPHLPPRRSRPRELDRRA